MSLFEKKFVKIFMLLQNAKIISGNNHDNIMVVSQNLYLRMFIGVWRCDL